MACLLQALYSLREIARRLPRGLAEHGGGFHWRPCLFFFRLLPKTSVLMRRCCDCRNLRIASCLFVRFRLALGTPGLPRAVKPGGRSFFAIKKMGSNSSVFLVFCVFVLNSRACRLSRCVDRLCLCVWCDCPGSLLVSVLYCFVGVCCLRYNM